MLLTAFDANKKSFLFEKAFFNLFDFQKLP